MKEWWNSSEDSSFSTLDLFFKPEKHVLPLEGEISMKGLAQVVQFLRDGGVIKGEAPSLESLVDLRYLAKGLAK